MEIILGIDIGGSTTKIVAVNGEHSIIDTQRVTATDQITAIYGAIGSLLYRNHIELQEVTGIMLTGVGASFVEGDIYGIPTKKVREFDAVGTGALLLSGFEEALVVSMGTGTSFVRANKEERRHVGGSGIGGGTLVQLGKKLCNEGNVERIIELAGRGNLSQVDLVIGDINKDISFMSPDVTAANFGKIKTDAKDADFALGLLNMIYQTAGTMAVLASADMSSRNIIVTGSMAELALAEKLLGMVGGLYGCEFFIPERAAYATAIGAASLYWS